MIPKFALTSSKSKNPFFQIFKCCVRFPYWAAAHVMANFEIEENLSFGNHNKKEQV